METYKYTLVHGDIKKEVELGEDVTCAELFDALNQAGFLPRPQTGETMYIFQSRITGKRLEIPINGGPNTLLEAGFEPGGTYEVLAGQGVA